jgi:hypothetical protein
MQMRRHLPEATVTIEGLIVPAMLALVALYVVMVIKAWRAKIREHRLNAYYRDHYLPRADAAIRAKQEADEGEQDVEP